MIALKNALLKDQASCVHANKLLSNILAMRILRSCRVSDMESRILRPIVDCPDIKFPIRRLVPLTSSPVSAFIPIQM